MGSNYKLYFQSYTTAFKETQEPGVLELGDDEFLIQLNDNDDGDEIGGIAGLGDIFDWGEGELFLSYVTLLLAT